LPLLVAAVVAGRLLVPLCAFCIAVMASRHSHASNIAAQHVAAVCCCTLLLCRWASSHSPYQPFMAGYFVRLLMAVLLTALARAFPPGAQEVLHPLPV
jgi:hypothetical protein